MADKTIASSRFRLSYHELTETVVVTANGKAIGRYIPASLWTGRELGAGGAQAASAPDIDPSAEASDHGGPASHPVVEAGGPTGGPRGSDTAGRTARKPPRGDQRETAVISVPVIRPVPKPGAARK